MTEPRTTEPRANSNLWLYRAAMTATAIMSAVAIVLLICHWTMGLLSAKAVKVMTFGSIFWLAIAFGYRADLKAREADDQQ